ncbi:hypothetical protein FB45DRAFT_1012140 [Roridomyces roridus]|uniref:Meiotically up-regulated protein Msb1/Mug8 domain-containing protein n=1 Tax=Roridomyces roridus TaxID=1738132 RepID=A0AAD7B069_9AGAR|nr:hypothetical protein FB45DRAFT_1012140 [Roridomyces roridus]
MMEQALKVRARFQFQQTAACSRCESRLESTSLGNEEGRLSSQSLLVLRKKIGIRSGGPVPPRWSILTPTMSGVVRIDSLLGGESWTEIDGWTGIENTPSSDARWREEEDRDNDLVIGLRTQQKSQDIKKTGRCLPMPSIFSRARTASTPSKASKPVLSVNAKTTDSRSKTPLSPGGAYDEFGRQTPTQAQEGAVGFLPTALPADPRVPWAGMSGSPNLNGSGSSNGLPQPSQQPPQPYGLLSPARDAVLGLPDLARLVGTVCAALERNGLATPFVFSSLALDVRRATVVRLVEAFLATCTTDDARNARAEARWADEARFAGAHELGMCLRWGLSRVVRVVRVEGGREVRGLFSWAWYERWRQEEAANAFPPTAYSTLLASLPAQLPPILAPLFALCNRLVAHSGTTGHTPPTLAAVLSPLLFGLWSSSVAFSYSAFPGTPTRTSSSDKDSPEDALFPTIEDFASFPALYAAFLRGAREGVHDAEGRGLGAPTRLREWVGMYPASLEVGEGDNRLGKTPNPRRGAKIVKVVHVGKAGEQWAMTLKRCTRVRP